jgi:hypothetical protein
MTPRRVAILLWLVFVAVAWNVIFDRLVWTAATDFTREQVVRRQAGDSLISIHEGFSPQVRQAALRASLWTLPLFAGGAAAIFISFRRGR